MYADLFIVCRDLSGPELIVFGKRFSLCFGVHNVQEPKHPTMAYSPQYPTVQVSISTNNSISGHSMTSDRVKNRPNSSQKFGVTGLPVEQCHMSEKNPTGSKSSNMTPMGTLDE